MAADSTEDGERPKPLRNEKQAKGVTEESKGGDDAKRGSPIEACADDTVDVKPSSATDGDVEMLDTPEPSQKKIETKQSASGSPQKPGCVPCGIYTSSEPVEASGEQAENLLGSAPSLSCCAGGSRRGKMIMLLRRHWALARSGLLRRAEA